MTFIWNEQRIIKGAAEAYPKDYPALMAQGHVHSLNMKAAELIPEVPNAPYNPKIQPFVTMAMTIEQAAQMDWHTINSEDITALDDAAQAQGLDTLTRYRLFSALAANDDLLLTYLRYNSERRSLVPPETPLPPLPRFPAEAVTRLQNVARRSGLPHQAAARITILAT